MNKYLICEWCEITFKKQKLILKISFVFSFKHKNCRTSLIDTPNLRYPSIVYSWPLDVRKLTECYPLFNKHLIISYPIYKIQLVIRYSLL